MLAPLLLLLALQAQDPVKVRSRLNDTEIRAGETTTLRVDVETDGERAQIQRFTTLPPGLELVGTRDYDQRQYSLPGGVRRFISREFVLRGRAPGRYRIPAVDVIVEGRSYTAASNLLTVAAAPARARGETRANSDGVMLRAWLDADTVYVGEQVTLEVEAMFSQDARLRLRRAPEYEPPSPSGFWIHDLGDRRSPVSRMVGDDVYEIQTFRRAFFPLSDGRYTIPPASLEYEMRRGLLYAPETRTVESDELPLVVLPVPADGRPPSFTGAVGRYTVRGWLEPARVPAGEAAVLTVEVDGDGNVKALPPPELPAMEGIEVFPPSEEAATETEGSTIRGRKRFSWVLIPRESGAREIPGIAYAYFDPAAGRYETAEVAPMTLAVEPGAAADRPAPAAATLRYLKAEPEPGDALAFVRSPAFLAAQVAPLLLLAGALVRRRRRGRAGALSPSALRRRRRAGIRELEGRIDDADTAFFADAEALARSWLAARLGVSEREAGSAGTLAAHGVKAETASSLVALIQRLAAARYAPSPPGASTRRDLLRALDRVLERADREAPAPRRGPDPGAGRATAGATAGTILLALGLLAGADGRPAAAQASPESAEPGPAGPAPVASAPAAGEAFAAGLALFDAGRYMDAAEAFDRHVEEHPSDAAGWYNLGTAYRRAGYDGYAVWAWLHVPRLDPRDGDTRHNLRVAGVAPELVARVAPALPLRAEEAGLLAGLAWLVAGVAGSLWVLRRGRVAGGVAIAGLVVALTGAAAAWDSTRGAETLIVLDAATLRAGPNLQAEPLGAVEPGNGLVPVARQGEWVRARTLRGEEGWIEAQETGSL